MSAKGRWFRHGLVGGALLLWMATAGGATRPTVLTELLRGKPVAQSALTGALEQTRLRKAWLRGLSADDLNKLRNAFYALRGYPFKSPELRTFFGAQSWYRPVDPWPGKRLEGRAKKNLRLVVHLERVVLSKRDLSVGPDGSLGVPLRGILNLRRYGKLRAEHRQALHHHGFFLAPSRARHLFQVYERNDYLRIPSFITTDLLIDLAHTFFDNLLRNVEEGPLSTRLEALARAQVTVLDRIRRHSQVREVREAAIDLLLFWAVATSLLGRSAPLPPDLAGPVADAIKAIVAAQGRARPAGATGALDLTEFKPRGHYARNDPSDPMGPSGKSLKGYFRAMTWLGKVAWPLAGSEARTLTAALAAYALQQPLPKHGSGLEELGRLRAAIDAFVGRSDATAPGALVPLLRKAYGRLRSADALAEPKGLGRFAALAARLPSPLIEHRPRGIPGASAPQLRIFGRRAFADSLHLQVVALRSERWFFSGLDVAAGLGSTRALALLKQHDPATREWSGFDAAFARGKAALEAFIARRAQRDAYHGTLHALRALFAPVEHRDFPAMRTTPWKDRSLQAFLTGWAELRHDTVLYGEPPTAECAMPEYRPPTGAVEPYPEVYRRLGKMVARLRKPLEALGMRTGARNKWGDLLPLAAKFSGMLAALSFCERIARKHLAGKALTRSEAFEITTFGGKVEELMETLTDMVLLSDRDKDIPVIADVATVQGRPFHVAVGAPDELYVVVRVGGRLTLMRGATMSYYEFAGAPGHRLTDVSWREMLRKGKAPARPRWLLPWLAPAKSPPPVPRKPQDRCKYSGKDIPNL